MSSFGRIFRVTTFGESHSTGVGCIIQGVPSLMTIHDEDIQYHLDRRRPGQSSLTTSRKETDRVQILSGIQKNTTLGTPICMMVMNEDVQKSDYSDFSNVPRPGHADYTYLMKYGNQADSGGGRSSARQTIGRVCAGAVAMKYLRQVKGIEICSFVYSVGNIELPSEVIEQLKMVPLTLAQVDQIGEISIYNPIVEKNEKIFQSEFSGEYFNEKAEKLNKEDIDEKLFTLVEKVTTRCPDVFTAVQIVLEIQQTQQLQDSIGGSVMCVISNLIPGLGEPCFDKVQALLAHAMMSIPATKGFQIGSGFSGTKLRGSEHNDPFILKTNTQIENTKKEEEIINNPPEQHKQDQGNPLLNTVTNNSGGVLGGITNGENIYFRVAFKPVSTIGKPQQTCNYNGEQTVLEAKGRHDPCVLPRAPPIVDAMAAITIMDCYLLQTIQIHSQEEFLQI